jgi:serine/threonine protein kinase
MDEATKANSDDNDPLIGTFLFHKYLLVKKLGQGSFGSIYSAKENNNWHAIKFENKNKGQNLLENEAYIMHYLNGLRIPSIKSFGYSGDYNVLIMELMGKSLEYLFENNPNKKMSIRCVCNLGYQMIEIMEEIHNKNIIHRDIKPDNFVMGRGDKSKYLYLLDFGLSKKYRSSSTLKHYQLIKGKKLTGTARYASINALNGITQSRRDDLEAIGYVLMYFLLGKLPWQGLPAQNKDERYLRIMEVKRDTKPEDLCKGFPHEFETYVSYTRNLEYEQDPDYDMLKNLFLKVLKDEGYDLDYYYDWDNDKTTMATSDTNQNYLFKNEFNNLEKNFEIKKIDNNNLNIVEGEDKEYKNNIKENIEIHEKNNHLEEEKVENIEHNNDKKDDNEKTKINDNENNKDELRENINNEIQDIINEKDIKKEESNKNGKKNRKHEKYNICRYRKNEENSCCIVI